MSFATQPGWLQEGHIMSANPARRDLGSGWYEIRVRGHLDSRWAAWFDGLDMARDSDGSSTLRGPVADQAALHGVLQKIRDLGLPLISVTQDDPDHQQPSDTENGKESR
jgi:hypothetical protein